MNLTPPGKVMPWNVIVDIEGVTVSMQVDMGPEPLCLSCLRPHSENYGLKGYEVRLSSYSGESIVLLMSR